MDLGIGAERLILVHCFRPGSGLYHLRSCRARVNLVRFVTEKIRPSYSKGGRCNVLQPYSKFHAKVTARRTASA